MPSLKTRSLREGTSSVLEIAFMIPEKDNPTNRHQGIAQPVFAHGLYTWCTALPQVLRAASQVSLICDVTYTGRVRCVLGSRLLQILFEVLSSHISCYQATQRAASSILKLPSME